MFGPLALTPLTSFSPTVSKTRNPNKQKHFTSYVWRQLKPSPSPSFYSGPKVTSLTQLLSFPPLAKVPSCLHPVRRELALPVLPGVSFRNLIILNTFPLPRCSPAPSYAASPDSGLQPVTQTQSPIPHSPAKGRPFLLPPFFESQVENKNYLPFSSTT